MKKFTILTAAVLALSIPALAGAAELGIGSNVKADISTNTKVETKVDQKADGTYVEKRVDESASKNSAGTETKDMTKTSIEENAKGDVTKTVETHSAVDPKGLMNQKSTDSAYKEEVKDGKRIIHRVNKVDGKTTLDVKEEVDPTVGVKK